MIFKDFNGKATRYLHGTYCLVRRDDADLGIFFIETREDDEDIKYLYLAPAAGRGHKIYVDDLRRYEFMSPPLGYAYDPNENVCEYIERTPSRNWKVGITSNNCNAGFMHMNRAFVIRCLDRIYKKDYPTFDTINLGGPMTPFTRKYSVFDNRIFYMNRVVGTIRGNRVKCKSEASARYHADNIGSLTLLDFYADHKPVIDPMKEDV